MPGTIIALSTDANGRNFDKELHMGKSNYKIIQGNVGKGREATDIYVKYMTDNDVDIGLIQEPYRGTKTPAGYTMTRRSNNSKTLTIFKTDLQNTVVRQELQTDNITTLTITDELDRNKDLHIINIYDEPGGENNTRLEEFNDTLQAMKGKILLAGDFNAKNRTWGGDNTDTRGEKLYIWTTINNYIIHNQTTDPPTFDNNRGRAWIDLQITRGPDLKDEYWQKKPSVTINISHTH